MLRKVVLVLSLLFPVMFGHALSAQTTDLPACFTGLEQATVGVPYYCDFGTALNQFYAPFLEQDTGVSLVFTFGVTAGTTLPPGLSITQSGAFSGTPTTPGSFSFRIDITYAISVAGQSFSETVPFPSTLQVGGLATGSHDRKPRWSRLRAEPEHHCVSAEHRFVQPQKPADDLHGHSQHGCRRNVALSVRKRHTESVFKKQQPAVASVNTASLVAGTYAGTIQLALSSGENFTLPVVLSIASSQQSLILSQSGLYFQAVQGGSSPPAQSVSVINGGTGSLNFTAAVSTLSGGTWLSVSPASGSADASSGASVGISVSSDGLAPATYYGTVQISAAGLPNSPQTVSVVLTVASPAQSPGPTLSSTGLIFVAQAGGTAAAARTITVTNPSPNTLKFSTTAFSDTSTNFYTVTPSSGTLTSGQPLTLSVQPATGLTAGVYTGSVTLVFADATTQTTYQHRLEVVLIVVPSGGSVATAHSLRPLAAGCTPSKLILVFTQLGDAFKIPAAWPAPLEVTTIDDCGTFMTQGTVIVTFSTGDPPLALSSLKDGRWSGTWLPRNTSSQVTIIAQGQETSPALQGSAQIGGGLQANPAVPVIDAGGVVSAASNTPRQPLAPGSYISVYGENLSLGSNSASSLPLQTELGGTQVILAGKALPLNYAGNGQINAIVPFDSPVNTQQQVIVQSGAALSVPEPVVLSSAQPAIFTQDLSGSGPGVIVGYKADGSASFLIDASHPVSTGDYLVIYCTGLGPVDQPVVVGNAGPSSPLANTLNPVTATIGGQNASVAFAGLAPTLTVYQVNLIVPPGVTPGGSVSVVLTQAGQQSLPVTIAVQ